MQKERATFKEEEFLRYDLRSVSFWDHDGNIKFNPLQGLESEFWRLIVGSALHVSPCGIGYNVGRLIEQIGISLYGKKNSSQIGKSENIRIMDGCLASAIKGLSVAVLQSIGEKNRIELDETLSDLNRHGVNTLEQNNLCRSVLIAFYEFLLVLDSSDMLKQSLQAQGRWNYARAS